MSPATYTRKQREVLEIIRDTLQERGMAPTLEEIGEALGVTRVTVFQHLQALEKKGAIRRKAHESRAIEITDPVYRPSQGIPLVGRIAAGEPILAVEDREDVRLEEYLRAEDGCFLLRVQGDSMIGDHIRDGDLVLVEPRTSVRNGEIVVAIVEEDATLKRLYREKGKVRLQPSNPELEPLIADPRTVEVRGVVRGVVRRV